LQIVNIDYEIYYANYMYANVSYLKGTYY